MPSAFKDSMTHRLCKSHYVSHFTAFFIVARAQRSVVKSCICLHFVCVFSHTRMLLSARTASRQPGEQLATRASLPLLMILPQVHLRKPCYDFYFL